MLDRILKTLRTSAFGGLILVALPAATSAQEVVSKRISVGSQEASLEVDFRNEVSLRLSLEDGVVRMGDREIGTFESGSALESALRSLIASAVSSSDADLPEVLAGWAPPTGLDGAAVALAEEVDRELESAVEAARAAGTGDRQVDPAGSFDSLLTLDRQVLRDLLSRTDRLEALATALEEIDLNDATPRVFVGEDVEVPAGEQWDGAVIVVDGDLTVRGEIDGDVAMVGGALTIEDEGRVFGRVRLSDARIFRGEGEVTGGVRIITPDDPSEIEREIRDRIRTEIRDELRSEIRGQLRGSRGFNPFSSVGHAVGGLMQNAVTFGLLLMLGALIMHFFPGPLDTVVDAVTRMPGRSGAVGLAGAFLTFPAWLLGIVALAVSIVGIPLLLAWIPGFPVAVLAAGILGLAASARVLGGWINRQDIRGLEWVRPSNSIHAFGLGLAALMLPAVASNVIRVFGNWTGFFRGMLDFASFIGFSGALAVGFGAVILTRAGRRPLEGYEGSGWDPDDPLWSMASESFWKSSARPDGAAEPTPNSSPAGGPTEPRSTDHDASGAPASDTGASATADAGGTAEAPKTPKTGAEGASGTSGSPASGSGPAEPKKSDAKKTAADDDAAEEEER